MADNDEILSWKMRKSYKGIVRVPLMSFENDESVRDKSWLDPDKVSKLISVFKIEGCQTAKWPVTVILDNDEYQRIVSQDGCCEEALCDGRVETPILPKNISVTCAQGKHRLEAGKYFLPNERYWWHAVLFVDVTDEVAHYLRGGDPQATRRKDGEIYRLMRLSQLANETATAQLWGSQLCQSKSNSKLKDINQLYRAAQHPGPMQDFLNALDKLLSFEGLWVDFQIGCFHRLLTLRCPEEMTTYLNLVYQCWSHICGEHACFLDPTTVGLLENRMPGCSTLDYNFISQAYNTEQIFSEIKDVRKRAKVFSNVLGLTIRIPSLRTFLEDTKYLEVGANAMKALLPKNAKGSIRQALGVPRSISPFSDKNTEDNIQYATYLKVWLFAFRNFPELTDLQPRKEPGKPKPTCKGQNAITWHQFAKLAVDCGFDTIQTRQLLKSDARRSVCETFLRKFKDYSSLDIPVLTIDTVALMAFLDTRQIQACQTKRDVLPLLADHNKMETSMERRCGRPFEDMFLADRDHLYYENVYNFALHESCKLAPSSFDIQCEIILSFFHDRATRVDEDMGSPEDPLNPDLNPDSSATMQDIQENLHGEPCQTVPSYPHEEGSDISDCMETDALEVPIMTLATTVQSSNLSQDKAMQVISNSADSSGTSKESQLIPVLGTNKCAKTNRLIQNHQGSPQTSHYFLFLNRDGEHEAYPSMPRFLERNCHDLTLWTVIDNHQCKSIAALDASKAPGVYWARKIGESNEPFLRYKDGGWHWCPGPSVACEQSTAHHTEANDEIL